MVHGGIMSKIARGYRLAARFVANARPMPGAAPFRLPSSLAGKGIRFGVRDGAPAHEEEDDSGDEKKSLCTLQTVHVIPLSFLRGR